MKKHPLSKAGGLSKMEADFKKLIADATSHVNAEYDVLGLHKAFVHRVSDLVKSKGERLRY